MKLVIKLIIGTTIIAASGIVIAIMSQPEKDEKASLSFVENTIRVQTATIAPEFHQPEIRLLGTIEARQHSNIVAELNGPITTLNIKPGDVVASGAVLLEIDNVDTEFSLLQAQADIADIEARIALQASQQNLDKQALAVEQAQLKLLTERLQQQRAVAASQQALADIEQQIQRQRLTVAQLEASVNNAPTQTRQLQLQKDKAQIALNRAQNQVNKTKITAPFAGKIGSVSIRENQDITVGSPLTSIFSHENLLVKVNLPLSLASQYEQISGFIQNAPRNSPISFSYANAMLTTTDSGIMAWFQLQAPELWLPGEVVDVVLQLPALARTHKVPVSALFQDRFIYIVDEEQRMQARAVQLVGRVRQNDSDQLLVVLEQPDDQPIRVITTRLNNPVTGSKIYEQGVDPEPATETEVEVQEASNENDQ